MTDLTDIYVTLKHYGYCRSQSDFSVNWLGRSRGYYAYLKSTKTKSCSASLGMLAARLLMAIPSEADVSRRVERRRLRSSWVAAMTIWRGVVEIKHAEPWQRVTALGHRAPPTTR